MRNGLIALAAIAVTATSGCTSFQQHYYRDYGVRELNLEAESAPMKLRKAIEKTTSGSGLVDSRCFNVPVTGDTNTCRQQRNATVALLLQASEDLCQEHLKTIFGNDAAFNIISGSIATLFSGAAAIAGSSSAKSALSAISAFANAERSLVNEIVYKNILVTAVTKKIREARSAKAAAMIPANFRQSLDDYPIVVALHDVISYHYMCSFMFGLERALEEGTQSSTDVKRARLEQEKRSLELYIDSRTAFLGDQKKIDADEGIKGAGARVKEIEAQLLAVIKAGSPASTAADPKPADLKEDEPKSEVSKSTDPAKPKVPAKLPTQ